jgi:hypothetical protein
MWGVHAASNQTKEPGMKRLLALCIVALACAGVAAANDQDATQASVIADCTREAVAKGYAGKELVESVAKCVDAKRNDFGIDPAILAAMSSC